MIEPSLILSTLMLCLGGAPECLVGPVDHGPVSYTLVTLCATANVPPMDVFMHPNNGGLYRLIASDCTGI